MPGDIERGPILFSTRDGIKNLKRITKIFGEVLGAILKGQGVGSNRM